jgi:hypothetical protein
MTRLNQALERARAERAKSDQTFAPRQTVRQPVRPINRPAAAEPAAPAPSTAYLPVRCEACGMVRTTGQRHSLASWIRHLAISTRLRRGCRKCGREIMASHAVAGGSHVRLDGWESTFLRPGDNRSFDDVIRDLARDEQEQAQNEHRPATSVPERTTDVLRPESWPTARPHR